jgi:D-Tyr-tRNAtyr deacylase
MKITKSELKEMIREALREELYLRENMADDSALVSVSQKLKYAIDKNETVIVNISSDAYEAAMTEIKKYLTKCNLKYENVDAGKSDCLAVLNTLDVQGGVLIVDNYNKASAGMRSNLVYALKSSANGQLFNVLVCVNDAKPAVPKAVPKYGWDFGGRNM